ncbi:hypothetical protein DL93DRAFT_2039988, partial [Clavulina sp. PMI_390]
LSEADLSLLRQFSVAVRYGITRQCWEDLELVFEDLEVHRLPVMAARVKKLSSFQRKLYDCCPSSCCCFSGPWVDYDRCPYCKHPRRRPDGSPYKTFSYLPPIPQLLALFSCPELVELMLYRSRRCKESNNESVGSQSSAAETPTVNDVYDSQNWKDSSHLFKDPRDIALLLTTDGFAPFKRR